MLVILVPFGSWFERTCDKSVSVKYAIKAPGFQLLSQFFSQKYTVSLAF
jgi:hypothetical protein